MSARDEVARRPVWILTDKSKCRIIQFMTSLHQARRLQQIGASLFLLALIVGLFIPKFSVPRLGLSTHLLGVMQGIFLIALGLLWPKLKLTPRLSLAAFSLAIFGFPAAWVSNLLAAFWGAGVTMLPLAAGGARGSELQETVIMIGLKSAAVTQIILLALIIWGLRGHAPGESDQ